MENVPKHTQANLYPSEVVTIAIVFAVKGIGNRTFYSWFKKGALDRNMVSSSDLTEPDLDVFDALEYAINHAHRRGGRAHIWAWGDQDRRQTPNFLPGGVLGDAHKRLMRYMAARLGPLPGWCMNFGFDTLELSRPESITSQ